MSRHVQSSLPTAIPADSEDADLKIWSCVTCRRRKVKCDRKDPCSNCIKNKIECHFPVTGRLPRRSRAPGTAAKSPIQKQTELLERLRRLEAVVTELTAQVEEGSSQNAVGSAGSELASSSSAAASDILDTDELNEDFGALVIDKDGSMHIGKGFWTVFCAEVDNIFQAVQDSVVDEQEDTFHRANDDRGRRIHGGLPSHLAQNLIFGHSLGNDADSHHAPLPSQIPFLWQTFVERVDPFIKVLHIPTIELVVKNLEGGLASASGDLQSLLFAVSLAAIVSLNEEEASINFGVSKANLVHRFKTGTELALSRASILTTQDTTVIAAFVIYVTVLQNLKDDEESRKVVWALMGLLIRLAMSAGLHRDGNRATGQSDLTPFDKEMRRRLWWHVCFADSRCHQPHLPEASISEHTFTTGLPSLLHDDAMHQNMTAGGPRSGEQISSSMIVCLVRCELWRLVRQLQSATRQSLQVQLQICSDAQQRIQDNYLRFLKLDVSDFDAFINILCALLFLRVKQVICRQHLNQSATLQTHSGTNKQQLMKQLLYVSTLSINATHKIKTEPRWAKWRWQLHGHIPWYAMGVVLTYACDRPWTSDSETSWMAVQRICNALSQTERALGPWQPVKKLIAYAREHRAKALGASSPEADHDSTRAFHDDDVNYFLLNPESCDSRHHEYDDFESAWQGLNGPSCRFDVSVSASEADWETARAPPMSGQITGQRQDLPTASDNSLDAFGEDLTEWENLSFGGGFDLEWAV